MNPFEFKRNRAILVFSWQLLTLLFDIYMTNEYICNHIHTYTQRRPQECTQHTDAICWCVKCISNGEIFHPWHDCPNWRTTLDKDLNKIKYPLPLIYKTIALLGNPVDAKTKQQILCVWRKNQSWVCWITSQFTPTNWSKWKCAVGHSEATASPWEGLRRRSMKPRAIASSAGT